MGLKLFSRDTFVGVDIGSYSIKIAQVEPAGDRLLVSHFAKAETPEETVRDGVVVDPDRLGVALRDLLRRTGVGATAANIAVAGSSVIVRSIKLPKMNEAALRKSIKFEAGKYVPSSVDDSYIEFDMMGDAGDGKMDVLVVAAPKDMVESRVAALHHAGLETEVVDIEGFALYRALIEARRDDAYAERTMALVDMGAAHTHISVVANGQFSLTRSIPIAGETLTEALKTFFRTDEETARTSKHSLDFSPLVGAEQNTEVPPQLRLVQPIVDEMVRELRRSINYYQTQQSEASSVAPVSVLLLSGGAARMKGIADYLGYKLGLPCQFLSAWESPRFLVGSEGVDPEEGSEYGVATGLAMRRTGRQAMVA